MLNGCFGNTKVSVADIDGIARQNGRCLFLEKKFRRGCLDQPQIWTINALVAQGNTVIAIWCEDPRGTDIFQIRVWGLTGYDSRSVIPASLEDFRTAVKTWWNSVYEEGKI